MSQILKAAAGRLVGLAIALGYGGGSLAMGRAVAAAIALASGGGG